MNGYEDLILELSGFIDTMNRYVKGLTSQNPSIIEILTLVAAILAVVASGAAIVVNRHSNEKIAKQAEDAENTRAEAAINANLTANARIEWIQNVRRVTAELISASYNYITAKEPAQQWEVVLEKKSLFVLYFGPDSNNDKLPKADNLLDVETNKGKNDMLVSFINDLYLKLFPYPYHDSTHQKNNKFLSQCYNCQYEDVEEQKCEKDEHGTKYTKEDCELAIERYKKIIEECEIYKRDTATKLEEFSEIMRIYMKIEWDRAKKNT